MCQTCCGFPHTRTHTRTHTHAHAHAHTHTRTQTHAHTHTHTHTRPSKHSCFYILQTRMDAYKHSLSVCLYVSISSLLFLPLSLTHSHTRAHTHTHTHTHTLSLSLSLSLFLYAFLTPGTSISNSEPGTAMQEDHNGVTDEGESLLSFFTAVNEFICMIVYGVR